MKGIPAAKGSLFLSEPFSSIVETHCTVDIHIYKLILEEKICVLQFEMQNNLYTE